MVEYSTRSDGDDDHVDLLQNYWWNLLYPGEDLNFQTHQVLERTIKAIYWGNIRVFEWILIYQPQSVLLYELGLSKAF